MTEIQEIYIPEIFIPEIYKPDIPNVTQYLEINPPGCTYGHRDIKNTGNHNLLLEDPNGVYTICDFTFPSFIPPVYNPNQMTIVEEPLPSNSSEPNIPETETPNIPEEEENNDIVIPECPSSKDLRLGDFRNDKKIERVIGHKLSDNKQECITLYEDVPFKDQYIPSAPQFVGVFSLALVGASAPLVLQLVRPLVKQVISKISKSKEPKSKV
tara:strand:+ start:517 stop:1152 length:636 start_codon:yes stop_codon:yes gene_type:complete